MFHNDGYALLIGVDDYRTYDESRSQAVGTSNLEGSRNDAKVFWRLCRLIGMAPAHIRILTSPLVKVADLEGATEENVGLATEAKILEQVGWLRDKLAQPARPTGIITYSGHGDWLADQGLVLCPSDVSSAPGASGVDGLAHAISFAKLNAVLAPHTENLTVVLDTCHSGMPSRGDQASSTRPTALAHRPRFTGQPHGVEELAGRVLAAAKRDQLAYQAMFDAEWRGVFSWAVTSAVEQWRAMQEGHNVRFDLTYGKLLETAARLLSALWFEQTPQLYGPTVVADLAVLQHGVVPAHTCDRPDAVRKSKQLDPGFRNYVKYTLSYSDAGGVNGTGYVLSDNSPGYRTTVSGQSYLLAQNDEFWNVSSMLSDLQSPGTSATLTFSPSASLSWPVSGAISNFANVNVARTPQPVSSLTWTSSSATPSSAWSDGSSMAVGFSNLSYASGTWSGTFDWWYLGASAPTDNLISSSSSTTLTYGSAPAATGGNSWWHASASIYSLYLP
jgi:hypothetical protein